MAFILKNSATLGRWLAAALILAPAALVGAQPAELVPGRPLRFDGGVRTVALAFDVQTDQFVHLEVIQSGVDVAVIVLDPAGGAFREVDQVGQDGVLESISWTRSSPGRYAVRLQVKQGVAAGWFEVRLDPPRASAPTDDTWLACERTLADASASALRADGSTRRVMAERLRGVHREWRALGDERWAAMAAALLGTYSGDRTGEEGLQFCLEAVEVAERSPDDRALDQAYTCSASLLKQTGRLEESIALHRELLRKRRQAGDRFGLLESLVNMSKTLSMAGFVREAQEQLDEAIEQAQAMSDAAGEAFARGGLAALHSDRGEYQQALDQYSRALAIPHAYAAARARQLATSASVQLAVGDLSGAASAASLARTEGRRLADLRAELLALEVLGRVHIERGELRQAIARLSHAVGLSRRSGLSPSAADCLIALGRAEALAALPVGARRHQQEALELSRRHGYRAGEVRALGALCALDDAAGVEGSACGEALVGAQATGHGDTALMGRYYLARAARRRGDVESARAQLEEALAIVASRRLELRRSDLRQAFSASVDDIEDDYVDLLWELADRQPGNGWDVRALEASERARGRSLRDALAESHVQIREGVDAALLEEDRSLRDRLRATLARKLDAVSNAAALQHLDRQVDDLHARLSDVEARIRLASPRFAALSQPAPIDLATIRAALLDPSAVLLYYALGERRSFLWVVTPDALERHVLPARAEIERVARAGAAQLARGPRATPGASLARLSRQLLAPAGARLTASRVVVVADGALHYVPFAALPDPAGTGPLVRRAQVVNLPSASAGALLARAERPRWTKSVAVFADPVFGRDDDRMPLHAAAERTAAARPVSLPRELGAGGLVRLPFTRREARAIEALAADTGGSVALDFEASRSAALQPDIRSYRFVHFATHGVINASHPELSGIVLSLVDRNGRPQNGFLTSLDSFNLRLDAELVVLSGCRTALGKDVRGEGIVGLTRGFMYAGARGVLASLWPVDDAATAELMRAFYARMLGPQELSPPAALREAQLEIRSDPRWRAPYYWAAFQLQGVWSADGTRQAAAVDPRK